jgi:hypothetical protein
MPQNSMGYRAFSRSGAGETDPGMTNEVTTEKMKLEMKRAFIVSTDAEGKIDIPSRSTE